MKSSPSALRIQILLCALLVGAFAGLIFLLPPSPHATTNVRTNRLPIAFQAHVIKVTDGDSITVRSGKQNIKVRLAQIDAPERGQPWGTRSREELARLVAAKTVTIIPKGQDRYGRMIGDIRVDRQDVNAAMVQRGAAWAYRDYLRDPRLIAIEAQAKSARVGLWALPEGQRLPPWEYRAARREAAGVTVGR